MKKEKRLSPRIERQIKIISKYYDVDFEKRVIKLELHYDSVDDLFVDDFVGKDIPILKDEILQRVSGIMESFPNEFTADIKLIIDDYKGMDPNKVFESFQDSLEMFHYQVHNEKSLRWIEAVILALISVGILFVRKLGLNNSFINDSQLITEMLDITAWVFLWQAVTVLFLSTDKYNEVSFRLISKMRSFALLNKEKEVVLFANQEMICKDWVQISKKEKVSRKVLIIAGAISFATGVTGAIDVLGLLFDKSSYANALSALVVAFAALNSAISIIGGIGAISLFREKGPLQRAVPFIAVIYLIVDIGVVSLTIALLFGSKLTFTQLISVIISIVMSVGASVLYFISYVLLARVKKSERKRYAKQQNA